jgi:hypothetical protein
MKFKTIAILTPVLLFSVSAFSADDLSVLTQSPLNLSRECAKTICANIENHFHVGSLNSFDEGFGKLTPTSVVAAFAKGGDAKNLWVDISIQDPLSCIYKYKKDINN